MDIKQPKWKNLLKQKKPNKFKTVISISDYSKASIFIILAIIFCFIFNIHSAAFFLGAGLGLFIGEPLNWLATYMLVYAAFEVKILKMYTITFFASIFVNLINVCLSSNRVGFTISFSEYIDHFFAWFIVMIILESFYVAIVTDIFHEFRKKDINK